MPIKVGQLGKFRDFPYEPTICPRCLGMLPNGYPGALSRVDNETEICSACGTDEALINFVGDALPALAEWPVIENRTIERLARSAETKDCEHEFENTYPMRECMICGLVEDAPEPIYDDGG